MSQELLDYLLSFLKPDRLEHLFEYGFWVGIYQHENGVIRIEMCDQAVKDGYLTRKFPTGENHKWYYFTEETKKILRTVIEL